jgi:hypothetical protein
LLERAMKDVTSPIVLPNRKDSFAVEGVRLQERA